ncbi:MAG: ATP-binding protein [Gammaproteobacteria bacterium]|nr:ATP-binding protein [Gammaproteobacteria bacterium]
MSIRHRLLLIIFLVALLPTLVVGYVNFTHTRDLLEQQALSSLERQALLKEGEMFIHLKELYTRTIDFSSDGFIRDEVEKHDNDGLSVALSEHLKLNKQSLDSRIVLINAYRLDGPLVASTSSNQPPIIPHLKKFATVTEWPYLSITLVESGEKLFDFFQPIPSRLSSGERAGYLQIRFNVELFDELMFPQSLHDRHAYDAYDLSHMRGNSVTYLVSQQGYLINEVEGIEGSNSVISTVPTTRCIEQGESMSGRWQNYAGKDVLGSSHCVDIGEDRWTLVTEIDQDKAYGAIASSGYFLFISLIFSIVLIIIAAVYLSNIIFRPIKSLHQSAVRISEGEWGHRTALKGVGELSELSHTFDHMLDTLRNAQNNLQEANQQLLRNNSELVFKQRALDEHTLVLELDRAGVIVSVNEALCDCSQYAEQELVGQPISILRPHNYSKDLFTELQRQVQEGHVWHGDLPGRRKDDSLYWVATTVVPFLDGDGIPERFLIIQTDITHQKVNEEKLSRSNRALTALAEMQGISGSYHDETLWAQAIADGLDHCYDATWVDIYHHSEDEMVTVATTLTAAEDVTVNDPFPLFIEQGALCGVAAIHQHLERFPKASAWAHYAEAGYYAVITLPIKNHQNLLGHLQLLSTDPEAFCDDEVDILHKLVGELATGLSLMRTQSDKERVEYQLSASTQNLEQAQEIAQLGSCEWFIEGDYQVWSAQLYRMLGYQPGEVEPSRERLYQTIHEDDRQMVSSAIDQLKKIGGVCNLEYRFVLESGEVRHISTKAKLDVESGAHKIIATMQDITDRICMESERKALEMQLKQSQRLQAIGQLTGGIAHDFNNMLAAILGYTDLAKTMILPDQANILGYLGEIEKAGFRARDLVQQMLIYSRREKSHDTEVLDLSNLLRDSLKMMKSTIPPSIAINCEFDGDEKLLIKGLSVELHQIVTNLVINARDAIGEKGVIDITLRHTGVDGRLCSSCQRYFSGEYVVLQVNDSGQGIPEQQLFSIFEPFFTTKEVGKGTGMGLSMVHGLVHNHDGHLCVESRLGEGTRFELYFPVPTTLQPVGAEIPEEEPPLANEIPTATRVMVVDDEMSVAIMIQRQLESIGLQSKVFFDSHQALAYFESHHEEIDLLISDQAMPGLMGHEMIAKMRALNPHLPVVVCTGFSAREVLALFKQVDGIEVVCKPVDLDAFTTALQRVLGRVVG